MINEGFVLVQGKNCFTVRQLVEKAAAFKGLKVSEHDLVSRPIKTYELSENILPFLREEGIEQQPRPDKVITFVDKRPQTPPPGYSPSNYWNFTQKEDGSYQLKIAISVILRVDQKERGVIMYPNALGTFLSPCDHLTNLHMLRALVKSDKHAPAVAKELVASNGKIIVFWADLGLGGIRPLQELFYEFAGNNDKISHLYPHNVFDPLPHVNGQKQEDEIFVIESAQPDLIKTWRKQLKSYIDALAA